MKLLLLSILTLASNAHADVAKPANTMDTAHGSALIQNVSFNYTVNDQGWVTSGHVYPGPAYFTSEKTFLMAYESTSPVKKRDEPLLSVATKSDAESKCKELATIEFTNQSPTLSDKFKQQSVKSEITNGTFNIYETASAHYFCKVTITVTE
jgi:hypothetical protein